MASREGSLEAPTRHAIDWRNPEFYDEKSCFDEMERDGNSIFIFEVAGLCIGHLGHLHHELDEGHYAEIGRLDV